MSKSVASTKDSDLHLKQPSPKVHLSYNKLLTAGTTSYSYDNNGNTISKTSGSSVWTYTYDYENRLRQVALNAQPVFQALYDGDGRRVQSMAGDTTVYDYGAGSWDPAYVKDLTTGLTSDIVFAAGLRIGKVQAGVSSYYHLDRLGSVRLVTQAGNQQAFSAKYLPYGKTYATSGAEAFQYTGKQLDVATGLSYYGYRYYDSQSGRFMTLDLAQANYLNPQSLNRYTYALDNPNRYTDPDGAKLPDAAYDIGRVAGASADSLSNDWDRELRDLEDAYGEYSSHHSHPMRFRAWLKMTLGTSVNTEPSDPAVSTSVKVPRGAQLALGATTISIQPDYAPTLSQPPSPNNPEPGKLEACSVNALQDYLQRTGFGAGELAYGAFEFSQTGGGWDEMVNGGWDIFTAGWDTGTDWWNCIGRPRYGG